MKCWLGASLDRMHNHNEEDCIRECIRHSPNTASHASLWERGASPLTVETVLQQTEQIYLQIVHEDRWLVCHPVGPGHLLIIDGEGKALLDQLASPQTLGTVLSAHEHIPSEHIKKFLHLFWLAGIVYLRDFPPVGGGLQHEEMLHAWLHITNSCNLGCTYCYVAKTPEHMPEETSLRAVDAIFRSARRHGFRYVTLKYAGGEASLRLNQVMVVHDYAQMQAQVHGIQLKGILLSNGVFFTADMIEQLKERCIGVMISLDGIGHYHDSQRPFRNGRNSFHYVNRTISRLLAHGLIPGISVTVSQQNLAGLPTLMAYLLEHDLPFSLNYYRDNEHASDPQGLQFAQQEMIDTIREAMQVIEAKLPKRSLLGSFIDKANVAIPHQYTCGVGRSYLVVNQHGGVAKCHAAIKQTVTTIDAEDPLWHVRNDQQGVQGLSVSEKAGCQNCLWRHWCTGGCPVLTYRITGRYDIKSPNCGIYQALFPDVLRLEALRLLKYSNPLEF